VLLTPEDISPSLNPYGFMSYELPSMFAMQDQFWFLSKMVTTNTSNGKVNQAACFLKTSAKSTYPKQPSIKSTYSESLQHFIFVNCVKFDYFSRQRFTAIQPSDLPYTTAVSF
jgi:hypothetical protein